MARSDLLITLVKATSTGDKKLVRSTVEALAAEERAKQHTILADRLLNALNSNGNGNYSTYDSHNKSRDFIVEMVPRKRLEDLILSSEIKLSCSQLIEEQIRSDLLRSHSLEPRHRVLLIGPPGNGKTSLAEALAESLGLPFFVVRYETMIGSYLGETASRLKRVFDYARTTPCVLFFDEFDAIGKERGDVHETGEIKRVVTSLIMQVDDLPSYTVVIAATNHSELLDRAIWRRFQLRLELPAPTQKELTHYFRTFLKDLQHPVGIKPETIAKKIGLISYAEAEQFCLDVKRRIVLSLGETPIKTLLTEQIKLWEARLRVSPQKEGFDDAGASTSDSS